MPSNCSTYWIRKSVIIIMEKTIRTIINLLIRKGLITKEEYQEEFEKLRKEEWDRRHNTTEVK